MLPIEQGQICPAVTNVSLKELVSAYKTKILIKKYYMSLKIGYHLIISSNIL